MIILIPSYLSFGLSNCLSTCLFYVLSVWKLRLIGRKRSKLNEKVPAEIPGNPLTGLRSEKLGKIRFTT